ncbi:MAG: hypothetical protein MUO58_11895 [Anaerolineales bacterium]|nr:hypothetical protein [Anaerolineales bacterium]
MAQHPTHVVLESNQSSRKKRNKRQFRLLLRILAVMVSSIFLLTGCYDPGDLVEIIHPPTLGPTPTLPAVINVDLSTVLDATGKTTDDLMSVSSDGWVRLEIPAGTRISSASGEPIALLNIIPVYSGRLPMDAYGYAPGFAYEFGPDEIHFDPKARLVFLYTDKGIVGIIPSDITIGIAYGTEEWKSYNSRVDMEKREIKISVSELLPGWRFMLLAPVPIGS